VEILLFFPSLFHQGRQALPCLPAAVPLLCPLQAIPEDPVESSRGLLGYFFSTQMDLIKSVFVTMGEPDPCASIINPLRAAPLTDVEEEYQDHPAESIAIYPPSREPVLLIPSVTC